MRIGRLRWWHVTLLAALVVLGAVLAASWAIVRVYGPTFTRERVEALLSDALAQPVRVGAVRLQSWRGRVSLVDIEVLPRATPPVGMLLRARSIDVDVDIASLWRRQLTISFLATDLHFEMTVPETETSGGNIFPLPQYIDVGPLHVGVGTVRVAGGRAVIRDPGTGMTIDVGGADVTARPDAGDLDVAGRLDTLGLQAGGRGVHVDRIAVDGRLSADLIRIGRIAWRWDGEGMQLDGEMRRPWDAGRELSLHLAGDVGLAAVAKAAGLDQQIEGKAQIALDARWADRQLRLDDVQVVSGTGRLKGRFEAAPQSGGGTSLSLDLREVVLPGSLSGLGPGTAAAAGQIRDDGLDLTRAEARWRGLTASVAGRIAAGSSLAARATLTADLREIGRAMSLGSTSGRASLSAELTGRGPSPAIDGRVEIADLVASGHTIEPVAATFRLAAAPGADARWEGTIQSPRIRWDQVTAEAIVASLRVDARRLELLSVRARSAGVPVEVTGAWEWAGSGRAHAVLGPVALGAIAGVPASARLGGTGSATVDATVERGVVSATANAKLEQVSAAGVSLGAGQADVRLHGPALEARAEFLARRLRATASGRLESGATLAGAVELDALALAPLLRELGSGAADHVDGRVSGRAELSLPLGQPAGARGVVRITPDGLRVFGDSWTSQGPLVLRWDDRRLAVERFRLDGPAGTLSATGDLAGPERRGLALALDNARLPGTLAELGRGSVKAEARLEDGGVRVTRLDAQWPGLSATGAGRAGGDGAIDLTARVDAELGRIGQALGVAGLGGRATLTATARGRGDAVEASGAVVAPRIEFRGAALQDVDLPLRLGRSSLRLEKGQARLGTSRVSTDASATWTGPLTAESLASKAQLRGEIRAAAARLEDLAPLLPSALQGRGALALTARAEGTPQAWRVAGTLTSPFVELGPGPLRQLRAAFTIDRTRAEVSALDVDAFGVPAHATASWSWAGAGTVKATLGPAPLAGLSMVPAAMGLRGTGRAAIDASVRAPADVTGTVRLVLDDTAVGDLALGRGQLDVTAQGGVFRADAAFPEQRLRASGTGRIDANGTLAAEATVPDVDLATLARTLGSASTWLAGALSARATARVPLADPGRGEGVLSIELARLVIAGETWESQGPIQVRWAQGGVAVADVRLAAKPDILVSAGGTIAPDGRLDARASAHVSLAMLAALRPEIRESGGVLDLSVRASGALSAPALAGEGTIHRGNLLLRDRPETLRDVEARFALSSQGVQLREATGTIGGGRIQARGDLALKGWQPGSYRFNLQAQNVATGQIEGFTSAWDADLEISGITREAQIEGRARLVRGAYRRDLSLLSLALSPSRAAAAETGAPLRLRVRVDLDDNLVVRSRIADLRAGGVLSVEGTTARPVLFGSIESRNGRISFRNRDWTVTSATVRFADPRRLDPLLDVLAATRIGTYDVTMQISGPVSSVTVRFNSTPRLSQNDLLSLVAFGATSADLRESPATVLLGEAGKMLAQNVLGLDPTSVSGLRISTGSSTTNQSDLHGFPGEERSISGPTARSSQSTPNGRRETVRLEYQLLAPLYLSGEYDRDGGYGADIVLRFRFR